MLTAGRAAALLAIAISRIDGLVAAGRLPRHRRRAGPRRFRLSEVERVDATEPLPATPRALRRLGTGTPRPRPAYAARRVSLREAAQIIGLTPSTLRRYYFGTPDLPRLPGTHYVISARAAHALARKYANRLTVPEAAAHLGTTHETVRQLLRDDTLPRTPDAHRPVRADQLDQILAAGWQPPRDPAHDERIPTRQAASMLGLSTSEVTERAGAGRLPAVRDPRGRWWFHPEQVAMVLRARHLEGLASRADRIDRA
jgi:hypothetical protein